MSHSIEAQDAEDDTLARLRGLLALPECDTVAPVDCGIAKFPSFFPGGAGFQGPTFPKNGVMLVGNNFGTISEYDHIVLAGTEFIPGITQRHENPTWFALWKFYFADKQMPIKECFFTNVYLGCVKNDADREASRQKTSNRGKLKMTSEYQLACLSALLKQIEITEPLLIALLGVHAVKAFAAAFEEYGAIAKGSLSLIQSSQPEEGYLIAASESKSVRVIALRHPSDPRSDQSKMEQGRLLRRAYVAAKMSALA